MALSWSKQLSALFRGITSKIMMIFIVSIAFIFFQHKTNVNVIKKYVKTKIFDKFLIDF